MGMCRGGNKVYNDEVVLCGASAYEHKYYFNEDFASLPQEIQDELKAMCVLYTEDVGGVLTVLFDEDGNLGFRTDAASDDFAFDEIGSALKIKQIQQTKRDFLESLETYYKVFFLDEGK